MESVSHKSGGGASVSFHINDKPFSVDTNLAANTSLNTFIREHAHLKGTKYMCLEGGCGACIVTIEFRHPATNDNVTYAANSCLVPVFSCHGWKITTIEGLGSKHKGYHAVQKRLAAANGTQCGYCSPGMVMNMHSLLADNPNITMKEVENSFGGNICRCTGYRPILDAFKSLAADAPNELKQKLIDIEDTMICPKNGNVCNGACSSPCNGHANGYSNGIHTNGDTNENIQSPSLIISLKDGSTWFRPSSASQIYDILDQVAEKSYRFVSGNTGQGVYRMQDLPRAWIDLNGVSQLREWKVDSKELSLGGNLNLTETMQIFRKVATEKRGFAYCDVLADHIDLIANVPVRNMGTLAGNIAMKHTWHEFPSDLFLILETVGGKVTIGSKKGEEMFSMVEFLNISMANKVILKFSLPSYDENEVKIQTYKIMPRAQNAHAYVNAGFLFKFKKDDKSFLITEKPSIVFGGIEPNFLQATRTEEYLIGKKLSDKTEVSEAMLILASELYPDHVLPDASPEYRKGLAQSLFFKFILSLGIESIDEKHSSGGAILRRPLSSGKQDFDTNKEDWPVNKPIPKIDGLIQCAGEAEYSNDIPSFPGEVWAQLVLCNQAGSYFDNIDASKALALPGVIAFYTSKDLPKNTFCSPNHPFLKFQEKVFAEGKTEYAGQAVGIIIAETADLALRAAKLVQINYTEKDDVIFDALTAIKNNISSRIKEVSKITPTSTKASSSSFKIKGDWYVPGQYHNYMECLTCVAVPCEDHLDIYPSCQWPASVHEAVSYALQIPQNQINLRVRRVGGGYGGKITLISHTAVACSFAAFKLNRPVRLVLNIETCMEHSGKRIPVHANYEAGVDDNGLIQELKMQVYEDDGYSPNDIAMGNTLMHMTSCYDKSNWNVTGYGVTTDMPSNTWCRAPGSTEGTCIIENIMDHIAKATGKDPLDVRVANMTAENPCVQMIEELKKSSDYENRVKAVMKFNEENVWKKRGISMIPLQYPFGYYGNFYGSVSIFKNDGTVALSHSAIEMGQGSNTKAVQVAAYILGVDVDKISIKPVDVNFFPNSSVTGGSFGSESAAYAIKKACEELNQRLEPIKKKLGKDASWKDIILEAGKQEIDLNSKYMFSQAQENLKGYNIYAVGVTEVEIDVLTGQHEILRMDVIEDAGQSLSPEVDIGQVEGSIVMGIGLFTSEELITDPTTGKLLTNRTWNYKPPGFKDIPIDLRITLKKNSPNPLGVLRSKATGEPPLNLTYTVAAAIRQAVEAARKDVDPSDNAWIDMRLPFTAERIWLHAMGSRNLSQVDLV